MAKEKKEEEHKPERKHLKRIVTEETHDGHFLHHHTYEKKRGEGEEPERRNVAVSSSPEEAGQHVAEQMAMNQPADASADPAAAGEPEPDGAGGAPGGAAPAGM